MPEANAMSRQPMATKRKAATKVPTTAQMVVTAENDRPLAGCNVSCRLLCHLNHRILLGADHFGGDHHLRRGVLSWPPSSSSPSAGGHGIASGISSTPVCALPSSSRSWRGSAPSAISSSANSSERPNVSLRSSPVFARIAHPAALSVQRPERRARPHPGGSRNGGEGSPAIGRPSSVFAGGRPERRRTARRGAPHRS